MGAEEKVVAKRMIVDNDGEEAEKDEELQPAPWTIAAIAWVDTEPLVGYHDNDVNSSDIPCVEYKDGKFIQNVLTGGRVSGGHEPQRRSSSENLQLGQCKGGMRDLQQCMASSCTDCRVRTYSAIATLATSANATQKTTRTRKINTLASTFTSTSYAVLSAYFCALSSVVSAK